MTFHLCSPCYFENLTRVFTNVQAGVIKTMLVLFVQYYRVNLLIGISLISKDALGLPEALNGTDTCANSSAQLRLVQCCLDFRVTQSFGNNPKCHFPKHRSRNFSQKTELPSGKINIEYKQGRKCSPHPQKGFVKINARYFMKAQKTKMLGKDINECCMSC